MSARPAVFTIPSEVPFLAALAEGLIARYADPADPSALGRLTLLLPTRRAASSLAEQMLDRLGPQGLGEALILPQIRPIGDVDEDALSLAEDGPSFAPMDDLPEPMAPQRRRLLLMRLVARWGDMRHKAGAGPLSAAQTLRLAGELERLIDRADTQGARLEQLARLAPAELSAHWDEILRFLDIIAAQWPRIEAAEKATGPARRRNLLMERLCAAWQAHPPGPVIAAGSTGTIPATAALLSAVAHLPEGAVILPGLDQRLDEQAWAAVGPSHPQGAMKALIAQIGIERADVARWPYGKASGSAARVQLLNEALRPWPETARWQTRVPDLRNALAATAPESFGLHRIDAAHEGEEARVIALILRDALETPGRKAALVTRDRRLARAVEAELKRWDIAIDDSAGLPLALAPAGIFLRLIHAAAREALAPVPLLALLKHPWSGLGLAPEKRARAVLALERELLRGPRPALGVSGLYEALRAARPSPERAPIEDLIDRISAALGSFVTLFEENSPQPFGTLLSAHIAAAEALAQSERLWQEQSAEALAALLADVLAEEALLPRRPPTDYPGFFDALIEGPVIRPAFGRHPRLFIWGALEARLHQADVIVLGGLNEGSWPAEPAGDPWMSRGMAEQAGFPPAEQRLGLAAHDLVQSAGAARQVYLTRAQKRDGAPAIASRWLVRLETLLEGIGAKYLMAPPAPWLAFARMLDAPGKREASLREPRPVPPREARPRRLSVTEIEQWVRDPYAIYARHVLRLRPFAPLDETADAALRGRIVHQIVEILAKPGFDPATPDALQALLAHGRAIFDAHRIGADLRALWWPRFEESASWLLSFEHTRRLAGQTLLAVEQRGSMELEGPGGPFVLQARADRIDRAPDGTLIISDYKTGQAPSENEMKAGLAPQLPLEAAIAAAGGFLDVPASPVSRLRVIRLMTARQGGEVKEIGDAAALAAYSEEELRALIARYDDPAYPYRPKLIPKFTRIKTLQGPYDHLARVKEWSAGDGAEDEA